MARFGEITTPINMTALQSVRRNAGDTAFEAYTVADPPGTDGMVTVNTGVFGVLGGSSAIDTIEATLTDDATHIPNSAAVVAAIATAVGAEDLWDRAGTVLSPHTANDYIQIIVADFPAGKFIRATNATTSMQGITQFHTDSTNNASDGFGACIVFSGDDSDTVEYRYANVGGIRSGADDNGAVVLQAYDNAVAENVLVGIGGAEVSLYYDNSIKLQTTANGIATNQVDELSAGVGVTIDGGIIKDHILGGTANYWQGVYTWNVRIFNAGGTNYSEISTNTSDTMYLNAGAGVIYHNTAAVKNRSRWYDNSGTVTYFEIDSDGSVTTDATNMTFQDGTTGPHTLSALYGTGGAAWWSRTGTILSPSNAGDSIEMTGSASIYPDTDGTGGIGGSSKYFNVGYFRSLQYRNEGANLTTTFRIYSDTLGVVHQESIYRYGGTIASPAAVPTSAYLRYVRGYAYDGTALREILRHTLKVIGTVATDNVAGEYWWAVRGAGISAPLTTLMRLDENGLHVDNINEYVINTGVTIEGINLQDYVISVPNGVASDGESIMIQAGDPDGATNDGGSVILKAGDALAADAASTPGGIYLMPGSPYQTSITSQVYIGDSTYNADVIGIQATGSQANVDLALSTKGTGAIRLNSASIYLYNLRVYDQASVIYITPTNSTYAIDMFGAAGLTDSDGNDVTVRGGAGNGTGDGGDLFLHAGAKGATGAIGDMYIGTGAAGYLPEDNTEATVVAYDTATGLLSYRTIASITGTAHALLSSRHTDTANVAVTRGAIIYGDSLTQWNRLAISATATHLLRTDGTDLSWGVFNFADLGGKPTTFSGYSISDTLANLNATITDATLIDTPGDNILDWNGSEYAPYSARAAGVFYTGATIPVSTNRLNYDGEFYAYNLYAAVGSDKVTITGGGQVIIYTGSANQMIFQPYIADGSGAYAYSFDTENTLATEGSRVATFKNNGTERFVVFGGGQLMISERSTTGLPTPLGTQGLIYMDSADDKLYFKTDSTTYDLTSTGVGDVVAVLRTPGDLAVWHATDKYLTDTAGNLTWSGSVLTVNSHITATYIGIGQAASASYGLYSTHAGTPGWFKRALTTAANGTAYAAMALELGTTSTISGGLNTGAFFYFKIKDSSGGPYNVGAFGVMSDDVATTGKLQFYSYWATDRRLRMVVGADDANSSYLELSTVNTLGDCELRFLQATTTKAIVGWDDSADGGTGGINLQVGNVLTATPAIFIGNNNHVCIGGQTDDATYELRVIGDVYATGSVDIGGEGAGKLYVYDDTSTGYVAYFNQDHASGHGIRVDIDATSGTTYTLFRGYRSTTKIAELRSDGDWWAKDFIQSSDRILKDIYQTVTDGLESVLKLNPVTYRWKDKQDDYIHTGFIAQEVQKLFPELVKGDSDGLLSLSYGKMSALAIAGVQGLNRKVDTIEDKLRKEIVDLKIRVKELENGKGS